MKCSARFASQERRLRRLVRGGDMSSGFSSLCEPRAAPSARHRTVPVPVSVIKSKICLFWISEKYKYTCRYRQPNFVNCWTPSVCCKLLYDR